MKKYNIYVTNPNGIPRVNEPIEVKLDFEQGATYQNFYLENSLGEKIPFQMYDEIYQNNRLTAATLVFISSFANDSCVYSLINTDEKYEMENMEGIKSLDVTQEDGFTRLDTGYYELELCSGKADGTASGKWGIRFFENIKERKNLIKDYSNNETKTAQDVEVGDILYVSWGYDMTIVDFYRVIERKKASIKLETLAHKFTPQQDEVVPIDKVIPNDKVDGKLFRLSKHYGVCQINGHIARYWNGKPKYYNTMD